MGLMFGGAALAILLGGFTFGVLFMSAMALRWMAETGDRLAQTAGCAWLLWVAGLAAIVLLVVLL